MHVRSSLLAVLGQLLAVPSVALGLNPNGTYTREYGPTPQEVVAAIENANLDKAALLESLIERSIFPPLGTIPMWDPVPRNRPFVFRRNIPFGPGTPARRRGLTGRAKRRGLVSARKRRTAR